MTMTETPRAVLYTFSCDEPGCDAREEIDSDNGPKEWLCDPEKDIDYCPAHAMEHAVKEEKDAAE